METPFLWIRVASFESFNIIRICLLTRIRLEAAMREKHKGRSFGRFGKNHDGKCLEDYTEKCAGKEGHFTPHKDWGNLSNDVDA
jgi:hypothetical protein